MTKLTSWAISVAIPLLNVQQSLAFSPSISQIRTLSIPSPSIHIQHQHHNQDYPTLFLQNPTPYIDATEEVQQLDMNGKPFIPGSIVAIAPNTKLKAYHVPREAFGSFDPTTFEFIPVSEKTITRSKMCLVLAEGIRGTVLKVYNVNEWDRTHPIVVKFVEGWDREGGDQKYHLPKTFLMHFDANEIMIVN